MSKFPLEKCQDVTRPPICLKKNILYIRGYIIFILVAVLWQYNGGRCCWDTTGTWWKNSGGHCNLLIRWHWFILGYNIILRLRGKSCRCCWGITSTCRLLGIIITFNNWLIRWRLCQIILRYNILIIFQRKSCHCCWGITSTCRLWVRISTFKNWLIICQIRLGYNILLRHQGKRWLNNWLAIINRCYSILLFNVTSGTWGGSIFLLQTADLK